MGQLDATPTQSGPKRTTKMHFFITKTQASSIPKRKPKLQYGRVFNQPEGGYLLVNNLALPPTPAAASNAVNFDEQI